MLAFYVAVMFNFDLKQLSTFNSQTNLSSSVIIMVISSSSFGR